MSPVETRLHSVERVQDRHDRRITALERWQWRTTGVLATLATVASLVGSGIIAPLLVHAWGGQ